MTIKLNPDWRLQPRAPRGRDNGGQWIDQGGGARRNGFVHISSESPVKKHPASVSHTGVQLVARLEGFSNAAYPDEAGYFTIGYGHKIRKGESFPYGISEPQARLLLKSDLKKAEDIVRNAVKVNLTQGQFDALTSLVFNIGGYAFLSSTLLRTLNDGNYMEAAEQILRWNKVRKNGVLRPSTGLITRREKERKLFLNVQPQ